MRERALGSEVMKLEVAEDDLGGIEEVGGIWETSIWAMDRADRLGGGK